MEPYLEVVAGHEAASGRWLTLIPLNILPASARIVWLALAAHVNASGSFPCSLAQLALETGLAVTKVNRELHRLHKAGLITRGRSRINYYTLAAPACLVEAWRLAEATQRSRGRDAERLAAYDHIRREAMRAFLAESPLGGRCQTTNLRPRRSRPLPRSAQPV